MMPSGPSPVSLTLRFRARYCDAVGSLSPPNAPEIANGDFDTLAGGLHFRSGSIA